MLENWKTTKIKPIIYCIAGLTCVQTYSTVILITQLSAISSADLMGAFAGTGVFAPLQIFMGLAIRLALYAGSIVALRRGLAIGLIGASLVALLNLPTLCFPVSFLMGWYLLPDEWRAQIKTSATPLFKKSF